MNCSVSPARRAAGCLLRQLIPGLLFWATILAAAPLAAQEPQWIWSQAHQPGQVPTTDCFFRKVFTMNQPERGELALACDDEYELFVNGRRIGSGGGWDEADPYDISRHLERGRNVVAVRVINTQGGDAGLVARLTVAERGGTSTVYSTDASWKASPRALVFWQQPGYNDRRWSAARVIGPVDVTEPWVLAEVVDAEPQDGATAGSTPGTTDRFELDPEFDIEQLFENEETGSLIAMAFNEFGQIVASVEEGPLVLLTDADGDGQFDTVRPYCDLVNSCQGVLPLNGDVMAIGFGPDGQALYRLRDTTGDGMLDQARAMLEFEGEPGEHGAHGLTLGPDGKLYIAVGNHATIAGEFAETSPYHHYYEGDLLTPKYEDPGGHARGIEAPAGSVIRCDLNGENVEIVAGGMRNCYDLAFTEEGALFTHDSDMEWDSGTSWYRPTRLLSVQPGAEFGWRSGWSKWPEYYLDSVPAVLDTGRGSPTGMVAYSHFMFPQRYHNALFVCDWAMGRILAVKLEHEGAGFAATSRVFLQGRPLNVTDIDVGPDGALYFCTGGRGTTGGVYRVAWRGSVPQEIQDTGDGITAAIRQPQFNSAWGRQAIAEIRSEVGDDWERLLTGVARSTDNPDHYRLRALDLMQLAGPLPAESLLIQLSHDESTAVQAKVTELMGLHANEDTRARLIELLGDDSPQVRRLACEALTRAGQTAPFEALEPLLAADDRAETWAACRLLETLPAEEWEEAVLESEDLRVFLSGSTALMVAHASHERGLQVIDECSERMQGFVSDEDFIDLLRVSQLAMLRGEIVADDIPTFTAQLTEEYPAGDATMNRELIRMLMHLQVSDILDRYLAHLNSDIDDVEKVHLAVHLRFLQEGWTTEQKIELLEFYENSLAMDGGKSFPRYVQNVTRDFASILTDDERRMILARGEELPNAALSSLYALAANPGDDVLEMLLDLDQAINEREGEVYDRLRSGCVAVLSIHGGDDAQEYLRQVFDENPERRDIVAMGLAQHPEENWEYLIRALPILDMAGAMEVLPRLTALERTPEDAGPYRQVILLGLGDDNLAEPCHKLLLHWAGETPTLTDDQEPGDLAAWQTWFASTWPDELPASLPEARSDAAWEFDELLDYLAEHPGGDAEAAERGMVVFEEARCASCHMFGDEGDSMGPDLTNLRRRYTQGEILQSILYPSHVISSQYASKTVITLDGRQFTGIVAPGEAGTLLVLHEDGKKTEIDEEDVDEIVPSRLSSMPEGLLDDLTLEQIADLFSLLNSDPGEVLVDRPVIQSAR